MGATGRTNLSDNRQYYILSRDARLQLAVYSHQHIFHFLLHQALSAHHVLHLGCTDTVRQRTQRTVSRSVGVATYNSHPRKRNALLRTHHVNNTLTHIIDLKFKNLKIATVVIQCLYLQPRNWVGNTRYTTTAFVNFRGHIVVGNRKVRIHAPGLAIVQSQTFKCLWRCNFVNQLAIYIQQRCAVVPLFYQMAMPQLVIHCLSTHQESP